jgi:hypothetical protein
MGNPSTLTGRPFDLGPGRIYRPDPMAQELPKMAEGLDITETEDGLIVYQESTDRVHHLNPTAAVVLGLCDGTRTVQEIARVVGETFALDEVPEGETEACVEGLVREKLII